MAKISVIVPVWNKEKEISKCLDTILSNTLKDIEIIVVDDKSTDNSKKIIKEYAKKHKNIIFIENKKNLYIGKTRNKGVKKATGEYLAFVDGDDYISLKMLKKYYKYATENKCDIVCGHYYKVNEASKTFFKTNEFNNTTLNKNKEIINLIDYGPCNKMFKRDIISKNNILFDEENKYEDVPFVMKALYHSSKIGHIKEAHYYYRIHENSETTVMDKRVFDIFNIVNDVYNYYSNKPELKEEIDYYAISEITRYMARQKFQKDKKLKNKFINDGYKYLKNEIPKWKKNKYFKNEPFMKKTIKKNKLLMKIYTNISKK